MIHKFLESVELSPEQGRIYSHLLENGILSAGKLATATGLSRPSVYDHLKVLEERGLAKAANRPGVKAFQAEPPERIGNLLEKRLKTLEKQKQHFDSVLPALSRLGKKTVNLPQFNIFEGADGLRHALTDILSESDIKTRSFLPVRALVSVLSGEFFQRHSKQRAEQRIGVQAIWALDKVFSARHLPHSSARSGFLRDIRIAPDATDVTNGYWIYGNKVVFFSCGKTPFGFVTESAEYAQMMTAQHDVMWAQATKLPMTQDDVRPFLREIGVNP